MKKTRRIAAMVAAMALSAALAVPSAMMSTSAEDKAVITITDLDESVSHSFEVYQVFTGTYKASDGTFSDLKWGKGVTSYNSVAVTEGALVADSVLDALGSNARAIVDKLVLGTASKTVTASDTTTLTIDELADGYYVIKDVTNMDDKDDANSAWIVQVAGTASIAVKSAKPTVDKKVHDETEDAEAGATDGWGESADHAINESFQFKLIAKIPASEYFAAYESYTLKFNDTMSNGVTFESIDSVKIASATLKDDKAITLNNTQYTENASENTNKAGLSWSLTINDVIGLVNNNGLGAEGTNINIFGEEEITVEVIYNAHLNENAVLSDASGLALNVNNNKVDLQYSNNPDDTGTGENDLGKTPEDYVWVFTYGVENTKYKISIADDNKLPGAGFTLYSDSQHQTAIKLIKNTDGSYTVADQSATSGFVTEMISNVDGIFNIKGLDAGIYYLSETKVPEDYNKAEDLTITITAQHSENTGGTSAKLTLTKTHGDNDIVDTKNSALPATGGMGTALFIIGGGMTAACAGIYLVSKKRAKDEDAE